MDQDHHGRRPPTRRRAALRDGTSRANENVRSQRQQTDKQESHTPSSPSSMPHNLSLVPNGSLAVNHEPESVENKRLSAVARPHNPKRDSEASNASTNASHTRHRRKSHIGPWQLGKTIGRGGCGRVRLVRHTGTGLYGAAKIISKATAEKVRALSLNNLLENVKKNDPTMYPPGQHIPFGLEREIVIMKLLDHRNIVRLYDIWENRDELYLIMEYVEGGELFGYIDSHTGLPEMTVVHLFRQIIAALQYCHRINIHHRDLKPENILLDRETLDVKLVDFGMAALQPMGKLLTTPCGSPHYAAPEVVKAAPYDGAQADVWSCGVILFVLLTGTPPFNYSGDDRHLPELFYAISKAQYVMPDGLSREAQDLIRRILVPDPKRRITIEGMWDHPFLRKYDRDFNLTRETASLSYWVGPRPLITDWQNLEGKTIDRELLRHLRTLWHSEQEEAIIRRLLNKEANQEKYFYSALQKYREHYLENYAPDPHQVAYSNSDHHHNAKRSAIQCEVAQTSPQKHKRTQSQYSILNDEHLQSKHSFYDAPASEASYDPFRASREPILPVQSGRQNVIIRRNSSNGSRTLRPATALGNRTGSSLRVQALKNSKRSSALSQSSKLSYPSQRSNRSIQSRNSASRSSLASSHWPSSPPVIARPISRAKRNVSFSHLRKSSVATISVDYTSEQYSSLPPRPSTAMDHSPCVRNGTSMVTSPVAPKVRIRKPESPTKYIQTAVRKISTELEKTMEEAFNRNSVSSSVLTGATDHRETSEYDTPPTSFSNRGSGGSNVATPRKNTAFQARPLPATPNETPNTFLQRKLAEARAEMAQKFGLEGNDEHYNAVLEDLDRLMVPVVTGKRTLSAPTKSPDHSAPLQVILEEIKPEGDDRFAFESPVPGRRATTDPIRPNFDGRRAVTAQATIRLVEQSSPPRVAPLNIRKRSAASATPRAVSDGTAVPRAGPSSTGVARPVQLAQVEPNLESAAQDIVGPRDATIKKKKSSWFRRTPEEKELQQENLPKTETGRIQIPQAWKSLDDRIKSPTLARPNTEPSKHAAKASDVSSGSEFPMRNCVTAAGKAESMGLKGLLGLFGKKSKDLKGKGPLELGADDLSSSSLLSGLGQDDAKASPHNGPDFQMNWLTRFFHIKPASKILCFHVGRGKVRQDLYHLLRDWRRFGVLDLELDRKTNVISARIDRNNHLKIKPVSLVIELFVVLEHGRRANLSVARFTQTRGAASSFRKVVDIIEDVCRGKHMIVLDEEKKAAMCEILA
ncbi:Pkinase-domain-containing protein [Corynespora cassiicola Philippines]|uniref:non-specific serine/threonine protein kinase n=1 Tax=Corynespora cassiicola Philippines TaxID=1448308 RepID=A0A2T2NUH4_CORCC|nr:Pkinase-domain-containing protein [Corynespora cassiicola Philippines]